MSAPILRLARITHGDPGKCACCDEPAHVWERTEILSDGRLLVGARYCERHDPELHPGASQLLSQLTVADVARLSPRRARRAAQQVERWASEAARNGRADAAYRGASSVCHCHALLSARAAELAETLGRLARLGAEHEP